MEFLYFLEGIRLPILDKLFQLITHLGEETAFIVLGMLFLWCIDKYEGYYLLTVGFWGTQLNQFLKINFRIDRPWVRDPNFKAVESAIPEATGYSFPSGHTQTAVGNFGAIARWNKKRWVRVLCILGCILVPFSRMYLGVHTPADVLTSLAIALVLVFALCPIIRKGMENPKWMRISLLCLLGWSVAQVLFVELFPFPADTRPELLYNAAKNAYKMLGAVAGFYLVYELDQRWIRFDTKGSWWVQLLKFIPGLALSLGVKELAYFALGWMPDELLMRCIAYFLLVLFAGAAWPLTFKYFRKLEKKN